MRFGFGHGDTCGRALSRTPDETSDHAGLAPARADSFTTAPDLSDRQGTPRRLKIFPLQPTC